MATIQPITVADFTAEDKATGNGVFDVMMRSVKEHVNGEYQQGRIKGVEYSTVYLGALQSTMDRALELLMGKDKLNLELQILELQRQIAESEKAKVDAEVLLIGAQYDKVLIEIELGRLEKDKTVADTDRIRAQKDLLEEQALNAVEEREVLKAQVCKLKAEFDAITASIPKIEAETALLEQKRVTEQAQISGAGVAEDSVLGRQIRLYGAQADGFARDAEQKSAKMLIDAWNVSRTTDEGVSRNVTNKLDDPTIGRAITKLLEGVGA
jgi:hypothetical protein